MSKPGYVYLMRTANGSCKIGRSLYPEARRGQIASYYPGVELIHKAAVADMIQAEWDLHARYSRKRLSGEWFNLTEEDIEDAKGFIQSAFQAAPEGWQRKSCKVTVAMRIDSDLWSHLIEFVKSLPGRVRDTDIIEAALEEYLGRRAPIEPKTKKGEK